MPQIVVFVILTMASVGLTSSGLGRSSRAFAGAAIYERFHGDVSSLRVLPTGLATHGPQICGRMGYSSMK